MHGPIDVSLARGMSPSTDVEEALADTRRTVGRGISDRLDRLPASRPVWFLISMLALGGWFEIYDMFLTAYIGPGLVKAGIFAKTTATIFDLHGLGAFVAALFLGLFIGTIGVAFIADRLGRRKVFVGALLCYTFAAAIMSVQTDAVWIVFWRVIAGIGVGAELVTIDTYVSEFVPARMRGRAFAFLQSIQYTSIPTIAFLSWQLVPIAPFGFDGWRWVVWIGCAGAVLVWIVRLGLPESPRWLIQQGRGQEAEHIVARIEAKIERVTGKPLPAVVASAVPARPETAPEEVGPWHARYRKRTLMLIVSNFFQSIGYYGFASWVPTLLAEKGVALTHSLMYSFIIAIASPLGPLLAMLVADRIERKWLIAGSATSMAVLGIVFAQQHDPVIVVAMGLLMTLAANCMTFSYRTYQAELFPTHIRARAIGMVYSASRVSAMLSGFLIAFFLRHLGVPGVFALIAGSMLVVFITIVAFGPRVRGLSLEQISQ
ncbi:MFS transporter [Caballeronia insecticola]|uniref:Major facilitator superfamily MFS_1 n=1 Tax=Caballeronia insecticola TaxID=758793 RepID=A0A060PJN5_9BURK|nr:MFS transporter [Caballeronia insecticola]BAO94138.1 major facilitator superfamily MFS_1 [Caballeronia insecticola]